MSIVKSIKGLVLGMLLCAALAAESQDVVRQLGSPEENVRQMALESLAAKGPAIFASVIQGVGSNNLFEDKYARRVVETIVFRSTAPGAKQDRLAVESALLDILKNDYSSSAKLFAIEMLSYAGGDQAVPSLAQLLDDIDFREKARGALERIPGAAAEQAIVSAIEPAQGTEWQCALLITLGSRGDAEGGAAVAAALSNDNPIIRCAAIEAAGRIALPQTEKALWAVFQNGEETERQSAANSLLVLAEKWRQQGQVSKAITIYKRFLQDECPALRCAGLAGMAEIMGEKALPMLIQAMRSPQQELRGLAQGRLAQMPGEAVTQALVQELGITPLAERLALIALVGERQDEAAKKAAPMLLETMIQSDGLLKDAAASALAQLPGEEAANGILRALADGSGDAPALLRLLGVRGDAKALPLILHYAKSPDENLQQAALEAIGKLGDPSCVRLVLEALHEGGENLRNAAVSAAILLSEALEKADRHQDAVALCAAAARATENVDLLRALTSRLQALGSTEMLSDMIVKNGYIIHWWTLGPIPDREKLRKTDVFDVKQPVDLSKPISIGGQKFSWNYKLIDNFNGLLEFNKLYGDLNNAGAYLYAEATCDQKKNAKFLVGSDDDFACYLNGEKVGEFLGDRGWSPDQDSMNVVLQPGVNRILLKALQAGGGWSASLRIVSSDDRLLPLPQKQSIK
ncbi:MAG: HEAT repeat domain-containing protein [Candidatus Omnitrophota bacterium]